MARKKASATATAEAHTDTDTDATQSVGGLNALGDLRLDDLRDSAVELWLQALRQPEVFARESAAFYAKLAKIIVRGDGDESAPSPDPRFGDSAWRNNGLYRRWLPAYQAWAQSLQNFVDQAGLEPKQTGRAKFLVSQVTEALAPTNFLLGNPAALKRAYESGGKSLLSGYQNWLSDVTARRPVPSQVDTRPFKVGDNLAATPGDVVLRTELFELLQFAPQTEQVHERPILVIPSIINKYYAFDLAPGRSLLEYLVQNGFTLFVMVFRNPGKEHDSWGMDTYMNGMDEALQAVKSISGCADPNVLAVCGAAPLAVTVAGYHEAMHSKSIGSMTLFVAPLDCAAMNDTPVLGDFNDPKLSKWTKVLPKKSDRISADEFTLLFAMLRPNDLIWNYWVNNYLMGEGPPAFDILAWNSDATGMTAQYNRDFQAFCARNPLATPGAMQYRDTPIADISKFGFDSLVIAARTDHICPWPSVYRSAQMLGKRCDFLLGGRGHIQTIVAPPGGKKDFYFLNPDNSKDSDGWLADAQRVDGSWWPYYVEWCAKRSGKMVAAPKKPGNKTHPSLGKAPGTYVHEKASS
ncbi:MAG: alpha/beta fold hydrolase [Burkholderiales bacterium]|nr:alpha/beta fold hydrolase [Burkholderiales bacterium]MBS0402286.1 alpha/beta fold hydrolase [Pseudomonadota bacterium]MBS0415215.1 alpha/beta fold hydrolase [Pseudomonadota bacterium]